jgi:adenylyltransferase/sulfurtransferase
MLATTHGRLALLALVLGALAAVSGDAVTEPLVPEVSAIALADRIRARDADLVVVDLRSPEAFSEFNVPTARNLAPERLADAQLPAGAALVLYAEDRRAAVTAASLLREAGYANVSVLSGGAVAWLDDVLAPVLPADMPADERARMAEISRYFGGRPRTAEPGATARRPGAGDDVAGRVRALRRRGCGI